MNRRATTSRRGLVAVETALVLGTTLFLLFGMIDLGLAACRYNVLSMAAGGLARSAIVRGSAAAPELTSWGPTAWTGSAADSSAIASAAAPWLCTMPLQDVAIQVSWPDGANSAGNRVQVQLNYDHQPLAAIVGQWGTLHLQATCTLPIVH